MAGKLDTRQKMINMMYLVFIAMLALNIGKEVLATLGVLNNDLESSITELEASSTAIYNNIESNSDSPDYKIAATNVIDIKKASDEFFDFIQSIKDSLIVGEEGETNKYLKRSPNEKRERKTLNKVVFVFFSSSFRLEKLSLKIVRYLVQKFPIFPTGRFSLAGWMTHMLLLDNLMKWHKFAAHRMD